MRCVDRHVQRSDQSEKDHRHQAQHPIEDHRAEDRKAMVRIAFMNKCTDGIARDAARQEIEYRMPAQL